MSHSMNTHQVIVYTVPGCPRCKRVFAYLEERGVPYREIDVLANDKEYAREMIEKSGQKTVPVTEIDGKIFVGFVPDDFEKALQ